MTSKAKKNPDKLEIVKPGIVDIWNLQGIFEKAINEEYGTHSEQTREKILKRHSILHLFIARFKPGRIIFVGLNGKKYVAVLLATHSADGIGLVNWIYVLPGYRKRGAAKKMLAKVEQEFLKQDCHKLTLTTEVAQDFYRKIGYKQEAVLKKHWWGKDFYLFSKLLK